MGTARSDRGGTAGVDRPTHPIERGFPRHVVGSDPSLLAVLRHAGRVRAASDFRAILGGPE